MSVAKHPPVRYSEIAEKNSKEMRRLNSPDASDGDDDEVDARHHPRHRRSVPPLPAEAGIAVEVLETLLERFKPPQPTPEDLSGMSSRRFFATHCISFFTTFLMTVAVVIICFAFNQKWADFIYQMAASDRQNFTDSAVAVAAAVAAELLQNAEDVAP